jgi:hypothetical protein
VPGLSAGEIACKMLAKVRLKDCGGVVFDRVCEQKADAKCLIESGDVDARRIYADEIMALLYFSAS